MPNVIYLYHASSGKEVITKFIDKLDPLTQARVRNALRLLKDYGLDTSAGHSIKKLSSKPSLYELRILGKHQLRLLFTCPNKNVFFITHIFIKKTQKTPINEIKIAKKRAREISLL
jgi:phage-related protein